MVAVVVPLGAATAHSAVVEAVDALMMTSSMVTIVMVSAVMVIVMVMPMMLISVVAMVMVVVRSVHLEPLQRMFLILKEQLGVAFLDSHFSEDVDDLDQAEGVQSRVVLLREPQGTSLPVRHLLSFAHLLVEEVLGDLGEA